ncbi:MAG TPA: outer membrane protein transport protein [Polyangia bacterium]
MWLAAAALSLSMGGAAHAAGFASARFGGEQGHATNNNPAALYFNPAGIGFNGGTNLLVDGVLAVRQGAWDHPPSATERPDPSDAIGANTGRARFRNVLAAPMLGATSKVGDFVLGGAFYVPFGGRSHWDPNPRFEGNTTYPGAAEGVQRWHSIEGAITVMYFTVGAAYRLGPLSLGITGNLISSSVAQRQAKNIVGEGEPDTRREGRAELDVKGLHGSFALGAMLEAIEDRLWFGLSYQAQPGLGEMALSGSLVTSYQGDTSKFDVTFRQALPDVTRWAIRAAATDWLELRLFGDITRWSVLQTQCISLRDKPCEVDPSGADVTPEATTIQNVRRRWRNTWSVRGGASFYPRTDLELLVGGGAEKSAPPPNTLEPSLMDADNLQGTLGARYAFGNGWSVAGSYTKLFYYSRNTVGRSELPNASLPTRRPDGGGKFQLALDIVQTSLEKRF